MFQYKNISWKYHNGKDILCKHNSKNAGEAILTTYKKTSRQKVLLPEINGMSIMIKWSIMI